MNTTTASSRTNLQSEVPEALNLTPLEALFTSATPPMGFEGNIEKLSRAYVELCLVVADELDPETEGELGASSLYSSLSSFSRRQLDPGHDGVGITNLGKIADALSFSKPRQFGAYVYRVGVNAVDGLELLRKGDGDAAALAEATARYHETGDPEPLESFFDSRAQTTARSHSPGPDARTGSQGPGGSHEQGRAGGSREGPSATGSSDGTNGCAKTAGKPPENQESGRSDGETEADQDLVYPLPDKDLKTVGTREQRRFLDLRARSRTERLFFLDLVNKARAVGYAAGDGDGEDWVVVGCKKIRRRYGVRGGTYKVWEGSELIEVYEDGAHLPPDVTNGRKGQARQFRVYEDVLVKWAELGSEGSRRWRLDTSDVVRTDEPAPMSTGLSDENNNEFPNLVDGALRILRDADHRINVELIEEAEKRLARKTGRKPRRQLYQTQMARVTIERQLEDGTIRNAYEVQKLSGRLSFKNGGPQGLLGPIKAKAYDISGYHNYDIRSCHTTALKEVADWLKDVGVDIDTSLLDEYEGKYVVADRLDLPPTLVKIVEHAVKYGAFLPASTEQADTIEDQIGHRPEIADAAEKYAHCPNDALTKLKEEFAPIRALVKEIAEALLTDYYKAVQRGGYMKNACGISFRPSDYAEGHERESKVMAWMLQGLEAAFVHSITILSKEYDYTVVANEHDGAVVNGQVPDEATERAREMSGFTCAEFVEKPFADEGEIRSIYSPTEKETGEDDREKNSDRLQSPAVRRFRKRQKRIAKLEAAKRSGRAKRRT